MIRLDPAKFTLIADRPVPVIIDTDAGCEIDDQFAIVYALLSSENIEIRGITAAPFFNPSLNAPREGMERSYQEVSTILELMQMQARVRLFKGAPAFMSGKNQPVDSPAVQFIISEARAAKAHNEQLFICAIGAITNVASVLLLAPELAENIVVIWLGGHALNWIGTPREFNLAGDVAAAQTVFESPCVLLQYPCNGVVSNLETCSAEVARRLEGTGAIGTYLRDIFLKHQNTFGEPRKVIWDIATISFFNLPAATRWHIGPRPRLSDDCTWSVDENNPLIMAAATWIDRDSVFDDMYARIDRFAGKKA